MACNSCAKPFNILRKEKSCPGCGFSYCSKCLDNRIFVQKLNADAKVCLKCVRAANTNERQQIEPPEAYYKRLGLCKNNIQNHITLGDKDKLIQDRLKKLKEDQEAEKAVSEQEISERLKKLKGDLPSTSDAELQQRLAKLKGTPNIDQNKPVLLTADTRTEKEQADDLMKQYLEQTQIDKKYQEEFDGVVESIEARLMRLKGAEGNKKPTSSSETPEEESDEELAKIFMAKFNAEVALEVDQEEHSAVEELPFCEICNEDATVRCLGCRYIFCKRCFMDHREDDDGCNRYEAYKPPQSSMRM